MTGPTTHDPRPSLAEVLTEPLATCRTAIQKFQRAPTPARAKRNINGRIEPVTDLDLYIQDQMSAVLTHRYPSVPIIGEERRTGLGTVPPNCLLIDPIDGTVPMLAGEPYFAVAICLIQHGRPTQAVIDLPGFDLTVSVAHGTLQIAGDVEALPAFEDTDVLTSPSQVPALASRLNHHLPSATRRTVRAVPTATIKLVLVSLRRAAAAIYLPGYAGAAPWDYAAAALTAATAGATVHDDTGRDLARTLPIAINGWAALAGGAHLPTHTILTAQET